MTENPTISSAGMRVVRLLVGNPPQTVAELIKATGVTRTAVTEQLNELVAAGFVDRQTERLPGRGRPRHRYQITDRALRSLFASAQDKLVPAIWHAIQGQGGRPLVEKVLQQVSRSLAENYNQQITATDPEERFRQFVELLQKEGGIVEIVQDNGQLTMRKRDCPFFAMVDDNFSVCYIDQEIMMQVVGRPVRQTACRHKGDPCCEFEIES